MPYVLSESIIATNKAFIIGITFLMSIALIFNTVQYGESQIQDKPNYVIRIQIGSSVPSLQSSIQASYVPDTLPKNNTVPGIPINSSVTWINDDESFHTVTSGSILKGPNGIFNSGILAPKVNWSRTFNNEGNFTYYCTIHPYMDGTIRVASMDQN
jgi:hypothetical protein